MLSLCLAASSLIAGPSPQPRAGVARRAQPRMVLEALQTIEALQTAGATAGVVVGTAAVRQTIERREAEAAAAEAAAAAAEEEEGELSIGDLLRNYGVIALLFHFTVWISTVGLTYSALSVVGTDQLVEAIPFLASAAGDGADGAGAASSFGKIAVTLGLVEAIGPARLALTIGATPLISERAREYEFVRSTEASIMQRVDGLLALLPSKED